MQKTSKESSSLVNKIDPKDIVKEEFEKAVFTLVTTGPGALFLGDFLEGILAQMESLKEPGEETRKIQYICRKIIAQFNDQLHEKNLCGMGDKCDYQIQKADFEKEFAKEIEEEKQWIQPK